MQQKRTEWKAQDRSGKIDKLVFLDESGVNIDMTRRYGRSIGKQRVVDHIPLNTPQTLTILSSMRLDGSTAYTTYSGGTTGERFVSYLKDVLIPTLHVGDIVVMDNLRSHHVEQVREVLIGAGMIPVYLPPYSPDLNPIEMLWSKVKSILRSLSIRCKDNLLQGISYAFHQITKFDCKGWFEADGYCL